MYFYSPAYNIDRTYKKRPVKQQFQRIFDERLYSDHLRIFYKCIKNICRKMTFFICTNARAHEKQPCHTEEQIFVDIIQIRLQNVACNNIDAHDHKNREAKNSDQSAIEFDKIKQGSHPWMCFKEIFFHVSLPIFDLKSPSAKVRRHLQPPHFSAIKPFRAGLQ